MERKIKIPNLNSGKEFELPERKVKHTRYVLDKLKDIEDVRMRTYDANYHTAYIILKEKIPDISYADIDELNDDLLVKINDIVWGKPKNKKDDDKDFQKNPVQSKNK